MNDRNERDFIRIMVIAGILMAVLLGISLVGVYGPVTGGSGPIVEDHVEIGS